MYTWGKRPKNRLRLRTLAAGDGILKLLWSPGIDSKEPIPPAGGPVRQPYIPTRFLAPIDCSKITAQVDEELLSISQDYTVKKG